MPQWYLDEPPLCVGDEFYFKAFWDLDTTRSYGMELGPIPWNLIVDYAERAELDEELKEPFVRIIRGMDNTYRGWQQEQSDRMSNKNEIGNKTREK